MSTIYGTRTTRTGFIIMYRYGFDNISTFFQRILFLIIFIKYLALLFSNLLISIRNTPVLHDMSKLRIPALLRLHINYFFTFKYKLALTMALYEGFGMSFVKMPKYLPTNKYQNKDDAFTYLKNIMKRSIIVEKMSFQSKACAVLHSISPSRSTIMPITK